ncbi:MAG: hypothetical protein JNJ54_11750 [Myxococcaceae bacterium]|nr:hypothetical protein [Myxococcaceae bacterium]
MRVLPVLLLSCLACAGPDAPDVAVCRDLVTRLCLGPLCEPTTTKLGVEAMSCEATLLMRTGCGSDSFSFTTPTRAQVLDCRVPLLRQGASQKVKPACADVAEVFTDCPDLVRFFGGTP